MVRIMVQMMACVVREKRVKVGSIKKEKERNCIKIIMRKNIQNKNMQKRTKKCTNRKYIK